MEMVSPLLDMFSRLWTCCTHTTGYIRNLEQNLNILGISLNSLRCQRDDVNRRVEIEELNPIEPRKCTNVVSDWLQRVQALATEVQKILDDNEAIKNDGGCYFYCWGRKNCFSAYKLGNLVAEQVNAVQKLSAEGVFQEVTYKCQPDPFQQIPVVDVTGMDAKFKEVSDYLVTKRNDVQIIGLYGMGGVGKTTLLQKINNEFAERKQFDLIIFVVVSKDLDLKSILSQIGMKLGISWTEETPIYKRAEDVFKVLKSRNFLLLLDDIWEGIDLETIGISKNAIQITGSKIIFTTRSKQVCGFMEADKRIEIECLNEDKAWGLFQQKVKQEALSCHPDVTEVAKKVAKTCRGLPLALIAIGRSMSSKTDLQQWQHALHTLQESASQFSGMANKVLAILKYSYDNLENEKLKSCFLYCSLFPEDLSFEQREVVYVWMSEGFLDNVDDTAKARNEGFDVIRCLKDACLLETGTQYGVNIAFMVKMHDVIRDLAIWILSDLGRKRNSYLTLQAESTLKLHEWEKAERISLINNKAIRELNGAPNCSGLLTLFLGESSISVISDDFFRFMPMLKVLHTGILKLKQLPTSIFSLSKLHFLEFPNYDEDALLTPGSLTSFTNVKILCLPESCCHWEVEGGPSLHELESLQHLMYLAITIGTGLALQRLVTSPKLQLCTRNLRIKHCPSITSITLLPSLSLSSLSLYHMIHLSFLHLENCDELEELTIMSVNEVNLFTTLEVLCFVCMPKLRIMWDVPQQRLCSVNLTNIYIKGCPQLRDIAWMIYAPNLELLTLLELDGLEELVCNESAIEEMLTYTFYKLHYMRLWSLRNLKSICGHNVKFLVLENILVKECPGLKKLPFNNNSVMPGTLNKIEGEKQWWERLEWEDEATKRNLAPYFHELDIHLYE